MYHEELMDHFKHPRNTILLINPTFEAGEYNPSCGDQITIQGVVIDGIITQISFNGKGCLISQAAASMLTERVLGTSVAEACMLDKNVITSMLGIALGPNRLKCAMLCLQVFQQGLISVSKKSI